MTRTLTYNQLKRLVLEARKSKDEDFTVDATIDLDDVRSGSAEDLKTLIESFDHAGQNLDEIESLHKELSKISADGLHDRANAKNEVGDAKSHERRTDFMDKAVKAFCDKAGEFEQGNRLFFKVKDRVGDIGIVLQSKVTPYGDTKKYGALLKLFEDEDVKKANPLFATLGAGLKATLDTAVAEARKAGYDIPDSETTWSASMYTRDPSGRFERVNEGLRTWLSGKWNAFKTWFAEKFIPKYNNEMRDFNADLRECDEILDKVEAAINDAEPEPVAESRRYAARRRFGRRY